MKDLEIITIDSLYDKLKWFIEDSNTIIGNYEDTKLLILNMIKQGYMFNMDRDRLRDAMEDITYMLCPDDDANKDRVERGLEYDDSDSDDLEPDSDLDDDFIQGLTTLSQRMNEVAKQEEINQEEDSQVEESPVEDSQVDVLLKFEALDPKYVNQINIYGNGRTKDKVIRREIPFAEGAPPDDLQVESVGDEVLVGDPDTDQVWKAPGYSKLDLHASYKLPTDWTAGYGVTLSAHVFNALDDVYVQDATDNSRYNGYGDKLHLAHNAEVFLGTPRYYNLGLSVNF